MSSLARHLLLYLGQCITPILQEGGLKEVKPLVVSSYSIMTSERFIRWIIATTESQTFGEKIPLFKKSYKIFATLHQSNLSQSILNFLTELFPQARLSLNTPPFIDSPHPQQSQPKVFKTAPNVQLEKVHDSSRLDFWTDSTAPRGSSEPDNRKSAWCVRPNVIQLGW